MERGIVSQVGTQAPDVIRAEPPLTASEDDIDAFARALRETLAAHAPSVVAATSGAARAFLTAKLAGKRAGNATESPAAAPPITRVGSTQGGQP
jgi:hypothetical protein